MMDERPGNHHETHPDPSEYLESGGEFVNFGPSDEICQKILAAGRAPDKEGRK